MAGLQRPFEPKPEAIEDHMRGAHTTLNLLPGGRFPARTRKTQLVTCRNRVHRNSAELVPSHVAQVYHKTALSATGSRYRAALIRSAETHMRRVFGSSAQLK